jgi:[NiFe] hydrogenase diaphorase moiety large subunit
MLVTEQDRLRQDIDALVERHGHARSALMPILQEIQRKCSLVSPYAMQVIADRLGIHPVEVHGVVSFYSFLSEKPKGRYIVRLCRTISCDMAGKTGIARQLENDLGIGFGETSRDSAFTLEWANCIGMCDQGPALLVNEKVFTRVTPAQVHEIIAECRATFGNQAHQLKEGLHS